MSRQHDEHMIGRAAAVQPCRYQRRRVFRRRIEPHEVDAQRMIEHRDRRLVRIEHRKYAAGAVAANLRGKCRKILPAIHDGQQQSRRERER